MPPGKRQRVLVVEDDAELRASYRRFLETGDAREFRVRVVPDAEQALAVLKTEPVDVVVLDWALPGISGASLAKAVRASARTRSIGILMVTARSSAADTVAALESGADDFLAKPFDWNVLLARLRSLARRSMLTLDRRLTRRFPGLELDFDADRLRLDAREISLASKQMDLLKIFLSRPDILHSRAYLWEAVWGYESDHWEHTLTAAISSLRRSLGQRWGPHLLSHKGRGYVFATEAPRIL